MAIKGGRRRHRRTKKHHRRKTKHHKRRRKRRRTRRRMRGGALPGIAITSPLQPFSGRWGGKMAAFPPGPMYKPGVNNDAKYYGKLDQPLLPDPTNTHGSGVTTTHGKIKGGRKRKRGGRKSRKGGRKSRKGGRKTRKGGRGRRKRGGNISSFLSDNVPGFSDVRDVYWKGGEVLKSGYNTWFGYNSPQNTSAGIQPIGKNKDVRFPDLVPIPKDLKSGALQARKFNVA